MGVNACADFHAGVVPVKTWMFSYNYRKYADFVWILYDIFCENPKCVNSESFMFSGKRMPETLGLYGVRIYGELFGYTS